MQMEQSLFKSASTIINGKLQQLLNNDCSSHGESIRLLTPQPAKQRLSFLIKLSATVCKCWFN